MRFSLGKTRKKSPFSECCLAVLELQSTLRAWSFPRVSAWMQWVHSEFRGFVLYSTSQFCLGHTQGRDTRAWPTRKVGLDKKGHKFTKSSEVKKKSYSSVYMPRKMAVHQPNAAAPDARGRSLTHMNIIFGHCLSCTLVNIRLVGSYGACDKQVVFMPLSLYCHACKLKTILP